MPDVILCVTEGEKTEVKVLERLQSTFLSHPIQIICFGTNIYQLYRKFVNEDIDFLSTYELLQEISEEQKGKRDDVLSMYSKIEISEIYLFFDYDGHDTLAAQYPSCIPEMLNMFDNETENGKLYISYPMVESFKHPIIKNEVYDIAQGSKYKNHVSKICPEQLNKFVNRPLNRRDWSKYFIEHIKAINFLVLNDFTYPSDYSSINKSFTQTDIYENQVVKYVKPKNHILVLTPFALFLLEYLGETLFEEWAHLSLKS